MADVNVQKRPDGQEQQGVSRRAYDPWRGFLEPLRHFRDDMDNFLSSGWAGVQSMHSGQWWPPMDVSEREGKLVVHADLPGIDKNDIKVEVQDGALTIRGERRREHEEERGGYRRSERTHGSFCRTIELPPGVKPEQVKAQFRDGVLEVSIPMPENQRGRSIPIEDGSGAERKRSSTEGQSSPRQSKTG
jgi:HSP20 family protein